MFRPIPAIIRCVIDKIPVPIYLHTQRGWHISELRNCHYTLSDISEESRSLHQSARVLNVKL